MPDKKNPRFDSERETRILLEQVHSEVRTVAEQFGSIQQKLREQDLRLDRVETQFGTIVADHEKRLKKVEGRPPMS